MLSRVQYSILEDASFFGRNSAQCQDTEHTAHDHKIFARHISWNSAVYTKPFPFLGLPWELRNEVYRHLFGEDEHVSSSMLYVNKHVGKEAWCALRELHTTVLVTLSLEQLDAASDYIDHMMTPDQFWTMPGAPHTSERIYRLPDTHHYEHMTNHHDYDLQLRLTDSDLLVSEKAANIVIIGSSALDTFARRFLRWQAPIWGTTGPYVNELQHEFIFSPVKSNSQKDYHASILYSFSRHIWKLPLVTITGAIDESVSGGVLQHLRQHRFTTLQMLVDVSCTLYAKAIHQWIFHSDQSHTLFIMRRLWEVLTMSWRLGEEKLMTDTITSFAVGGRQHVWNARDVFEYLIPASRLVIAGLHIQRADRSTNKVEFDVEMTQADHHAKSALEQAKSMGNPYATIWIEAHMTLMVTSQALARRAEYRQAGSRIREALPHQVFPIGVHEEYIYRLHEQRRGKIFLFRPRWMKAKLAEMVLKPQTCKTCNIEDAARGVKRQRSIRIIV